jgi:predicted nucleic acid-binding protein
VIAYFDTSALVPLLIDEPATERSQEHWSTADRVVTVRLARVEARAALAQAARGSRISPAQLRSSTKGLDDLIAQLDLVDIDDELIHRASDLAESQALRAYDAVHLAAALRVADDELIVVAGDRALVAAASALGLAVATTG